MKIAFKLCLWEPSTCSKQTKKGELDLNVMLRARVSDRHTHVCTQFRQHTHLHTQLRPHTHAHTLTQQWRAGKSNPMSALKIKSSLTLIFHLHFIKKSSKFKISPLFVA